MTIPDTFSEHGIILRKIHSVQTQKACRTYLAIHYVAFDATSFHRNDFAVRGISCPQSVERSAPVRQAEFLFGRLAARSALASLDINGGDVLLGRAGEPAWPPGVVGSISHTRTLAVAATVRQSDGYAGVGLDVENVVDPEAYVALLATVVSLEEVKYIQTLTGKLPMNILLTIVFSAKESLFKGAYNAVGRFFDFGVAIVKKINVEEGRIWLQLTETLCDGLECKKNLEVGFLLVRSSLVLTYFLR